MELAMQNVRAVRREPRLLLLSTVLLAVGAAVLFAAVRADADSVGTLQVHGTYNTKFSGVECPAGTPATTGCYRNANVSDELSGLGKVTVDYTLVYDDFGLACGRVHAQIPIVVAGKGEIDLAIRSTGCIPQTDPKAITPSNVTVTGGSGRYAGASGSGVLEYVKTIEAAPGSGSSKIMWTGTLNVAGLAFDTTAPQITGPTSKAAKTRTAKGARVGYSVSAADATDGPVTPSCLPKSGSLFRVGRKTVTCSAADGSGNVATASFVVTVKRVRR
jgi:HYR domain